MHQQAQQGLMRTYREGWRARGFTAVVLAVVLTGLYLDLYFTEHLEPVARRLFGMVHPALVQDGGNKWFLYGFAYGIAMSAGALYYLRRHGNSRYNRVRIGVNLGVQWVVAFLVPFYMKVLTGKDYYFSYLWPLKIEYFYPQNILSYPLLIVLYSFVGALVMVPLLTLRYGKRWYCSWVCGCGALANTMGDPWRHLSSKTRRAWRFEKVAVHTTMAIAFVATIVVGLHFAIGDQYPAFGAVAGRVKSGYGLVVGILLQGVIGVGVYPLLGPRVWCRFFCPMAAMVGLIQKAGRFRIAVKKDMCISCGNCSAYCEMGIDVRAYAQRNESFTRAACVGCGMCAHVCPRGVLRLENRSARDDGKPRQRLPVIDM